jgi:hypothetical protein
MLELLKNFFTKKEAFTRGVRGLALALGAAALTPEGQALLANVGGTAGLIVPILVALIGGAVAVGEKNKAPID